LGRDSGLSQAHAAIGAGQLVVLPVEGVYALAADAFEAAAVRRLRVARRAAAGPNPPLMVGRIRAVDGLATGISGPARYLMEAFWPGPLTLICDPQPSLRWGLDLAQPIAVRMPLHPVALRLLRDYGPLVVTAAAAAGVGGGGPGFLDCPSAEDFFGDQVEVYLDAGVRPGTGQSTVIDVRAEDPVLIRAGDLTVDELLAVAPELILPATAGQAD
jgi:tRNA threonylcarbamoyl adenosine modification protein (Sua5/YciO/YrdC/YwlC family)